MRSFKKGQTMDNFDTEYKQFRIKRDKQDKKLADIRAKILLRLVGYKSRNPSFDGDGFMKWWDCLSEWTQIRHGRSNPETLMRLRDKGII